MFTAHYDDIGALSYGLTKRLVYAGRGEIDLITSADTQLHDVLVTADACTYDEFDLKKVWLTPSRWSTLVRQYIDPTALESWLQLVETKLRGRKRGISFMRTEVVRPVLTNSNRKERRRYGSCMLGLGYRAMPKPQITLHSRTTYLGYIGQLDLALAAVIAREVGQRVGLSPESIGFAWHLEVAQFHGFKSLAWFYQQERDRANLEKALRSEGVRQRYPTMRLAARQLDGFLRDDDEGKLYGDMSFAQQLRVRRRFHTEVMGYDYGAQYEGGKMGRTEVSPTRARVLPSVKLADLDLSALRAPGEFDDEKAGLIDGEVEA